MCGNSLVGQINDAVATENDLTPVIASGAKQSSAPKKVWIASSPSAPRNDVVEAASPRISLRIRATRHRQICYTPRMTVPSDRLPTGGFAPLVPELAVFDLARSTAFWCDVLGFTIAYQRPENNFERQGSQVMLDQANGNWETGPLKRPLGRGINFQMFVESVEPLLDALKQAGWPLYKQCHDAWYRIGDREVGSRQFLVQDPDGYLLRFAQDLGTRQMIGE